MDLKELDKKAVLKFGKPICVGLYVGFAYLAAKKKPLPLITLVAMHTAEYVLVARKLGKEKGLGDLETAANCLAFGFTWWKPIKKNW